MSRHSAANEVFLWARQHEADRNITKLARRPVKTGRMTAFMALGERSVGDAPLREVLFKERSLTIEMESPLTMGREWAGPRIETPHTGSRTEDRVRRWRS